MGYLGRQLSFYTIGLWLAFTFTFFLPQLLGQVPSPPRAHSVTNNYLTYLWNLVHLDFGVSSYPPFASVNREIAGALPWTLILAGGALILGGVLGAPMGMIAAWRQGGVFDTVVTAGAMFLGALPLYFFGLAMIFVLGVALGWTPLGLEYSVSPSLTWAFVTDSAGHAILPVFTLTLATCGPWLLLMRNATILTLQEEYVLLAQAKGLRSWTVMVRYAARNALLPVLTNLGIQVGYVIGGVVLAERIFSYPGMGSLLFQAVSEHDYSVVQALIAISAAVALTANLLTALLYARLDPRVRGI